MLLPVYNDERFITASVESVLAQTFCDFELLVVDDGSTDGTAAKLRCIRDPRIRLWTQSNRGLAATLGWMVDQARGEYIARMDSDDVSAPERFFLQVAYLDSHPDVGFVGSSCVVINEDGSHRLNFEVPVTDREIRRSMLVINPMVHSSIMMRKAVISGVGGYDPLAFGFEDYDLWLRVMRVSRGANLDRPLVRRVHRANSVYRQAKAKHYARMVRVQVKALMGRDAPPSMMLGVVINSCKWFVHRVLDSMAFVARRRAGSR